MCIRDSHEMEMKVREEREAPKKKAIAFKDTPIIHEEDDSSEDCDEDFVMLIWKVGKMFYRKGRQSNFQRGKPHGRFEKKREEPGPCFHCKKIGHSGLPRSPSYYLQACTKEEEGYGSHMG